MIPELNKGDKLPAAYWNEVARNLNRAAQYVPEDAPLVPAPLYGIYTASAPVYSVFGVFAGATQQTPDVPVVNIAPIGSTSAGFPFGLVTNGAYPATADKLVPLKIITYGHPVKLDVDSADASFVVGKPCGPKINSLQTSSSGVGFVCLTAPATYQTSRKFIWAFAQDMPTLVAKTTGTITSGLVTPSTATVNVQNLEAGVLTTDYALTVYNTGPAISDPAGKIVLLVPVFGLGYTIVTGGGGGIIDIRITTSNEYQYTFDGSTWTTFVTGGGCP